MSKLFISLSCVLLASVMLGCDGANDSQPQQDSSAVYSSAAAPTSDERIAKSGADSAVSGESISTSAALPSSDASPGSGSNQQGTSLTAGAFSDALNLTAFMNYLQSDASNRVNLPPASPFTFAMEQEKLKALLPVKEATSAAKLDVALVIDVTGSMGDELSYLQKEWASVANNLQLTFPNLALRMSVIAYKDRTDEFVTSGIPFTDSKPAFDAELAKYTAGGGGDQPEAVDAALAASNELQWDASSRKVMFWVADASPHEDKEAESITEILKLRDKGVSLYPLAASGVDSKAELIMRIGALLTGGQYLFLTDDSGLGNSHALPHVPCYNVERLNQLLQRILTDEVNGTRSEPKAEDIIRTVGKPVNGECQTLP